MRHFQFAANSSTFLRRALLAAAILSALPPATGQTAQLSSQKWTFSETDAVRPLGREMADGDLNTAWTSPAPVTPGIGIEIDLGQEAVIHRLFFTPGKSRGGTPRSLKVVLDGRAIGRGAPTTLSVTLPAGKRDVNLLLDPVIARRVRLVATAPSDQPWSIAELEIYGTADPAAFRPVDAVVVDASAAAPLRRAAEELSYYIGELTGKPLPLVAPDDSGDYPGTLYRIVDLKPLAATWEEMEANRQSGKIPAAAVNVERAGREVIFKAWPYANVRFSVWALLERQGVRWLYPDDHGDWIPAGRGVNLDCLPLRYTPCATRRYANFEMAQKTATETNDPVYLFWWRNGYNSTWGSGQWHALGGSEVPRSPHGFVPEKQWKDDYKEGFWGYPHNFESVLPNRIINQHPDWWGSAGGKRAPPSHGGPAVCMTSPGVIQFIVDKVIALTQPDSEVTINLLPMDAARFCDCERCRRLYEPLEKSPVAHSALMPFMVSDAYYNLVAEVAKGIRPARPKVWIFALAYADVLAPPRKIEKMPDNVTVEICHLGAPELPMTSPVNGPMRACTEEWRRKCDHLEHYEYVLLNESKTSTVMPVPLVSAMVDRARFFRSLDEPSGGTQADSASMPYSPWNHYAYPRLLWNPDRTADELLDEFFAGYFREAKAPMLAYYRTLENHLTSNDVSLRPPAEDSSGVFAYGVKPGSFPYGVLVTMRGHLEQAEKAATSWLVAQRVARMREGFEWVLKESCFTATDLDDPSGFLPVPADGTPARVDLAKIRYHKEYVEFRKQGDWLFGAHGMIGADLRLEAAGEYVITVTAKGVPCENVDPVMHVYLDHHHAGSIAVAPKEFKEYTFRVSSAAAGMSRLVVSYWNAASGGRRNLVVKEIRVAHAKVAGTLRVPSALPSPSPAEGPTKQ